MAVEEVTAVQTAAIHGAEVMGSILPNFEHPTYAYIAVGGVAVFGAVEALKTFYVRR